MPSPYIFTFFAATIDAAGRGNLPCTCHCQKLHYNYHHLSLNTSQFHLFFQFWQLLCEVYSELQICPGFSILLGAHKHQVTTIRDHWYFQNHMLVEEYNDSLMVTSGVNCNKTKAASSQMSFSLLYKSSLWGSTIHTSMSCTKLNTHWNYYKHGGV
jgi:hypothetical protein